MAKATSWLKTCPPSRILPLRPAKLSRRSIAVLTPAFWNTPRMSFAIANDIRGVFQKAGVNTAMERLLNFAGRKGSMRDGGHVFSQDVAFAIAVGLHRGFGICHPTIDLSVLLNWQLRLFGIVLAFSCAHF